MKSKKKLIIALSSFAFVLVAAVVTVTAVLAAANQSINTSVSVVYYAKQVAGTVSATYQVGEKEAKDMTTTGLADGKKLIEYAGKEANVAQTLKPQDAIILLTANDDGTAEDVVFTYTFTNNGAADYTATVKYTDTEANDDNYTIDYSATVTFEDDAEEGEYKVVVGAGETVKVTITVAVDDVAQNSEFSGTFAWSLLGQEQ